MLDDGLAAVAGGEIDVDVGPGRAVFGEEALEEEAAPDGVAGGDLEAVADRGVGGRSAALAEDALGLGELDELPDDEEVAGEPEAFDEGELVLKLFADFLTDFAVTVAGSAEGEFAEEEGLLAGAEGAAVLVVGGKLVAEVLEGELEAVGEAVGVEEGLGVVVEEAGDLFRVLEVALGIGGEEGAGLVEGGVVAEAGEGVGEEAVAAAGEEGGVWRRGGEA